MPKVNETKGSELLNTYPLNYILLTSLYDEIVPFEGPNNTALLMHWERHERWFKRQGSILTFHLPDIEVGFNTVLLDTAVLLPTEIGARLALNIDP